MKGRTFYSYFLILLCLVSLTNRSLAQQTITISSLSSPSVLKGCNLTISYTISGTFTAGNVFKAELSDETGVFPGTPSNIGSVASTAAGNISATIPVATLTGTAYKVRITSSNPVRTSTNSVTFSIDGSPGVSSLSYCVGQTGIPALTASGTNLKWYTVPSGGSGSSVAPTPLTSSAGTTTYYVTQTLNGCESTRAALTVTVSGAPPAPTSTTPPSYCQGESLSPFSANGSNLKWYTVSSGGTGSSTAPTPAPTGTTTYYVTQTVNGCESSTRTTITVAIKATPSTPATTPDPTYCQNQSAVPLSATASASGTLNWYGTNQSGSASSTPNTPSTLSAGDFNYYVSQTVNGCESAKATIKVSVKSIPPVPGVSPLNYCVGQTGIPTLTATLQGGGVSLNWYRTTLTSETPSSISPVPSTTAVGATTYYVSQKNSDGCEGPRAALVVTVNSVPSAPTATTALSYCQGDNAVALTANGSNLKWYGTSPTGGSGSSTATIPPTNNAGATTYYVTQTVNGCESSSRTGITVTIKAKPDAPVTTSDPTYCQGQTAVALSATASASGTLNWYGTNQSGSASSTPNTPNTNSAGDFNYYISQTVNGCESSKAAIKVTVKATPSAPAVSSPLIACQNRTGYALSANPSSGGTLKWYGTSQNGGTATSDPPTLSTSTLGSTTYYVSQSVNNCEGPRAALTVTVNTVPGQPSVSNIGPYCEGVSAPAISASGQNLKWYGTNQTGGSGSGNATVPSTDAASIGTKTYYVTQTVNGCESDRLGIPVLVKDTPDAPGISNIDFCQGYPAPTLTATSVANASISWYGTSASGGTSSSTAPTPSNSSPGTTIYYVSQTLDGCEGPRAGLSVRVKSTPGAPGVSAVSYCNNSSAQPLSASGSNLKWYDASDNSLGGTPTPNTGSVGTQTFKVSQTSNENCEGPKATLTVTIKPLPGAPSVNNVVYCQAQQDQPPQNIQALSAGGQNLRWYNADGNQFPNAPTPSIDKGGIVDYYVSQTVDNCEGPRAKLQASIVSPVPPTVPNPLVVYCINDVAAPLKATGDPDSKLKWIDPYGRVTDSATPLTYSPSTDPTGDAFYVYQIASYGCYSARTQVKVLVNAPPTLALVAPTTTVNLGQRAPLQLKFTSAGPFSYTLTGGYMGTSRTKDTTISVLPRANTIYQIITVSNVCGVGLPGNPATAQINVRVPTVSTSSINATTICSGTSLTVPFTTTGQFNTGNAFRIEVVSATDTSKKYAVPASSNNSPVTGVLPTNLPSGPYFVRVNADNPEIGIVGSNSPTQLTIRSVASATLTGTQNIYEGMPVNLTLTFGGDAPWTATYVDSLRTYPTITTSTSPYVFEARPSKTTTYRLTSVTNACGNGPISGTATVTILPLLGVDDNPLDPLVKTYPVPTETTVMVELDLPLTQNPAILSLKDAGGRPVFQQTTRNRTNELNLTTQPNGVYFLHIQVGDRQTVRKVLKQ